MALVVFFLGSVIRPDVLLAQGRNPESVLARAKLFYETGKYQEALDELLPLISGGEEHKPHIMVEIYKYLAFCNSAFDQRDVATRHFKNALKYDPNLELDPVFTSPKIMALFKEARAEFLEEYQRKMEEEKQKTVVVPPKKAPQPGSLEVTANVVNAVVYLDGRKIGITPMDSSEAVIPGKYAVRVSKDGYQDWEGSVSIEEGEKRLVRAELNRLKKPWYKRAWIWGTLAAVVGGGIAATAIAGGGENDGNGNGDTHADVIVHY